ncbi:ribonuclease T2-like protein [Chlamydoabsidia padenii]|nr:ribonuclease T2-like protein [Chlamydoabsidia padenii]
MNNGWPNPFGHVDEFWSHEWNKHGVCMSTFEPKCYDNHDIYQGMIDYYNTTMNIYRKYDIYRALERHGIVPGYKYTTDWIKKVIQKEFNVVPDLRCNMDGHLEEMWMYFYVKGPVKRMDLIPTHNNNATNCNMILFYPFKYPNDI